RDHAAQWTVRLGDGTEYSRERMIAGLHQVWPLVEELFVPHQIELRLAGMAVDPSTVRSEVDDVLDQVLHAAALERPAAGALSTVAGRGGRDGVHTETFGYLLAEMQHIARSMPGAIW